MIDGCSQVNVRNTRYRNKDNVFENEVEAERKPEISKSISQSNIDANAQPSIILPLPITLSGFGQNGTFSFNMKKSESSQQYPSTYTLSQIEKVYISLFFFNFLMDNVEFEQCGLSCLSTKLFVRFIISLTNNGLIICLLVN